jgi:hypothetical protein
MTAVNALSVLLRVREKTSDAEIKLVRRELTYNNCNNPISRNLK